MQSEKNFLRGRKKKTEKEIMKLKGKIQSLQNRLAYLDKKIDEENIVERVLVTETTITETSVMNLNESNGIISQGYGVDSKPKSDKYDFRFLRKGSKIICTIYNKSGEDIGKGVSKCHYEDEFDYLKGIKIAEFRAKQDMLKRDEQKLY